jgi:hypothetical protein
VRKAKSVFGSFFLIVDRREWRAPWRAPCRVFSQLQLTSFEKCALILLLGTEKYENRNFLYWRAIPAGFSYFSFTSGDFQYDYRGKYGALLEFF